jgi:hypothetical protein
VISMSTLEAFNLNKVVSDSDMTELGTARRYTLTRGRREGYGWDDILIIEVDYDQGTTEYLVTNHGYTRLNERVNATSS